MSAWHKDMHRFISVLAYQTGRTIASTSLRGGMRRSVGWTADVMWQGLVDGFEQAGLSQKVAADMMGLTLRTYQRRVQSLQVSHHGGQTYWMLIYTRLKRGEATRDTILGWFDSGLKRQIVSLLRDMLDTGWVVLDEEGMYQSSHDAEDHGSIEVLERFMFLDEAEIEQEFERLDLTAQERDEILSWQRAQAGGPVDLLSQSGIYQAFRHVTGHVHDFLRQAQGHKAFYGTIDLEELTDAQQQELLTELEAMRARSDEIMEKYASKSPTFLSRERPAIDWFLSYQRRGSAPE